MKHIIMTLTAFVLTGLALAPAISFAGDLDDLDVTMEVLDDTSGIDDSIPEMQGPVDGESDAGVGEEQGEAGGDDAESDDRGDDDYQSEDDFGHDEDGGGGGDFEHDQDFDEGDLDREDDFEDEQGEDRDLDEYDDQGDGDGMDDEGATDDDPSS